MNKIKNIVASFGSLIALALFIAPPALAAGNLVTNGSFEQNSVSGPFITVNAGDSTTIPGWNVTNGNVDQIGNYWTASDGNQSLDMNGTGPGTINQTFSTLTGHHYSVTFAMAGNPDGGNAIMTMDVTATGGTTSHYSFDTTGHTKSSMGWTPETYTFTASGTSTILTFASTVTSGPFGPALDNVVVTDLTTTPSSFADCRNGGYANFVNDNGQFFTNEGLCIAYVARHLHRTEGSVGYTALSLHRHGQWSMANDGSSAMSAVGAFSYMDANQDWYVVIAKDLKASGNKAWFAGPVISASQPSWVGNWLFAEVEDNSPDMIWGSFTNQTTAETGVMNMTNPADGPFTVTSGNLTVH